MTISLSHEVIIAALNEGYASPTRGKKRGQLQPFDAAKAMRDIERAVSFFEKNELSCRNRPYAKKRHRQYVALQASLRDTHKKLSAILNTPEKIDPFVWAWWIDEKADEWDSTDRADIEAKVRMKLKDIAALGRWVSLSSDAAKPAKGRPRGSPLQRLVSALSRIYFRHTGSQPAYFRPPRILMNSDRDTSGRAQGPFLDFICAIASNCNIRCTREGVASALDELKKTEDWHFDLHYPDPKTRAAEAMDEMQQQIPSGRSGKARGKLRKNLARNFDLYDP